MAVYDLFEVLMQTETTNGTTITGFTPATHLVRAQRPQPKPSTKLLENKFYVADDYQLGSIASIESDSEVSLKCPMDGWKASPADGDYPISASNKHWVLNCLDQSLYGWYSSGSYATVVGPPTSSAYDTFTCDSAPASYVPGMGIGIMHGTNLYLSQIKDIDGTTTICEPAFGSAAAITEGDKIYPCYTLYPETDRDYISGRVKHLSIQCNGKTSGNTFTFSGCHIDKCVIKAESGERLMFEGNFKAMRFNRSGSALSHQTYNYEEAPICSGMKILYATTGSLTHGTTTKAHSTEFDLGTSIVKEFDDNDADCLAGWEHNGIHKIQIKTTMKWSSTLFDDQINRTPKSFFMQVGNALGKTWAFYMPHGYIEPVQETNGDGQSVSEITLIPCAHSRHTALATAPNPNPINKSFYIFHV